MKTTNRKRKHRAIPTVRFVEPLEQRVFFSIYTVTTLSDATGVVTPAGTGRFNATTLRAAVNATNAHIGADTINFAATVVGTINLTKALPPINDALTVTGPGFRSLMIQRGFGATTNFSIFHINTRNSATIAGLNIAKGTGDPDPNSPGHRGGGGIFIDGKLTLTNCMLSGNSGADGGGIYNNTGGTLAMGNCTLSGNSASSGGGGIFNRGSLTVGQSTLSANTAKGGGGIQNYGGRLTMTNSTLSGNWGAAATSGGGIQTFGGSIALNNCTLSGNSVTQGGSGGGINNYGGTVAVTNCTLSGNSASNGNGGGINTYGGTSTIANSTFSANAAASGGGIYNNGAFTLTNSTLSGNSANTGGGIDNLDSLVVANSIVAGNSSRSTRTADIVGVVGSSSSFNVIGTGGSGGLVNGVHGNQVGVLLSALKLGPLAFNGGPTKTFALLSGSIAINAGSDAIATSVRLYADQRGMPRKSGGRTDVGAFEVQALGGASIAGTFFNDKNRDGIRQSATEPGLVNWQVYVDQNKNGIYDPGEITTFTSSTGTYKFTGLAAGSYRIYEYRQDGWTRTKPAGAYPLGYYDVTLAANQAVFGKDFGNYLA